MSSITSSIHGKYNRQILISQLQSASNGFDLRGCTVISEDGPLLDTTSAFFVGIAFGEYIKSLNPGKRRLKVGIGKDPRESGNILSLWLASGIEYTSDQENDVNVEAYDVGLATTPSMFVSCSEEILSKIDESHFDNDLKPWPFEGAVSITASHLPSHWNGFKFFTPFHPSNIGSEGLERMVEFLCISKYNNVEPFVKSSSRISLPFLPIYSKFLQYTIKGLLSSLDDVGASLPLKGLKVVVNAGNGAGGFLADCLSELGADTSDSLNLLPDGSFPSHIPNPEDKIAISMTADQTKLSKATLGICLDCDADRVGIIDGKSGKVINRNNLVALVSTIALQNEFTKGGTIVTDSATSNGITRYVEMILKGKHLRFKKGYRYVIEKARTISDSVAAIECSGHGAWKENGWVDDGCYTAIRILTQYVILRSKLGDENVSISSLISDYSDPIESTELRLKMNSSNVISRKDITNEAVKIINEIGNSTPGWSVEPINYEGIRVNFNNGEGWVMMRSSLHEPMLSLHIESEVLGGIKYAKSTILQRIANWKTEQGLSLCEVIDLQPLT